MKGYINVNKIYDFSTSFDHHSHSTISRNHADSGAAKRREHRKSSRNCRGTVAWATGKVLEGVGIVVSKENEGPGLAMLFTGLALDFFGPLSSAIGEKVAKNAVGQDNRKGLNSTLLSGGATYGISWALVVVPVAGEVMRGVSAIAPLVRISRYQRQVATVEFDISPYVSIQTKKVGLSLSAAF